MLARAPLNQDHQCALASAYESLTSAAVQMIVSGDKHAAGDKGLRPPVAGTALFLPGRVWLLMVAVGLAFNALLERGSGTAQA